MDKPERGGTDDQNVMRSITKRSLPDSGLGSSRELGAVFDQSPIAMVFNDRELRTRRTNAAFRRLAGLPDEALIGRRPSEADPGMDAAWVERTLTEQVIGRGFPVINMHVESTLSGKRRVLSWSAYPVTDNGQVLGAVGSILDITDRMEAVAALRQANARLGLLERAGTRSGPRSISAARPGNWPPWPYPTSPTASR